MRSTIACRAVAVIIQNNHILFAKNNHHTSAYYLVGGGIEQHESSRDAVVREIYEETGLSLEVDRLILVQERFHTSLVNGEKCHEIAFYYLIKSSSIPIEDGTVTDQGDNETLHWLPIDKLSDYDIVPPFLKTFDFGNIDKIRHITVWE